MITLSGKQRQFADRLPGIELMLPWPADLPLPKGLQEDEEEDGDDRHYGYVRYQMEPALKNAGIVIRTVKVAMLRRPPGVEGEHQVLPHIVVSLVHGRWLKAVHERTPRVMWAMPRLSGQVAEVMGSPAALSR